MNGVLNMVLGQLGIIERYVVWLGDPKLAIWMIVAARAVGGHALLHDEISWPGWR